MKHATSTFLKLAKAFPSVGREIDSVSVEFHRSYENWNYDARSNGERWILQALAKRGLLDTTFDVGANRGGWASLVLEANPQATVHCFEVCPPTYDELSRRFAADARVHLNTVGLSDATGDVEVNYCAENDELSSMFSIRFPPVVAPMEGKVMRGIDYCTAHGISRIDCLKIDVEGAEHLVLHGFDTLVTPAHIPIVQFEYGVVNILTKFLLKDFYDYFTARGYRVGKLFPTFVRFREYRFEDEDFYGPNFIAASPEIARQL